MGRSLTLFPGLIPPVHSLHERYTSIPAGQTLQVAGQRDLKIIFFLEGGLEVQLPDNQVYKLEAWDALTLSEPWLLRYRAQNPAREMINHIFALRLRRGSEGDPPDTNFAASAITQKLSGFHHFPRVLAAQGPRLLQDIREEAEQGQNWSRWRISGVALQLLGTLLETGGKKVPLGESLPEDRGLAIVNHARQYIQEHAREKLTLTQIAWHLQLSGEHLARLFRQHAGCTVFDYVDQVRLEHAKRLLLTSDLPVAQLAPLCGYGSANLLGRHFKTHLGITPLDYRLRARKKEVFTPSVFAQ
jgi:AraC-like DNA-binding protein